MQTVWLEFKRHGADQLAALGTDTTFFIDGRWSAQTTKDKINERIFELRKMWPQKYGNLLFVGITHSQMPFYNGKGGAVQTMQDPNPPEWARKQANNG